ncbi:MAG TPA: hypothetical protein VK845_16035 [Gemmatimonadales bacterium]|nr:hypothetical protein [Gemmatimonadales bacterium]
MEQKDGTANATSRRLLWVAHGSVWILAILSTRLSIVNAKVDMHITGRNRAELAPAHLREVLGGPTTEFRVLALAGTAAAVMLAMALRPGSPKWLRRATLGVSLFAAWAYLVSYGLEV